MLPPDRENLTLCLSILRPWQFVSWPLRVPLSPEPRCPSSRPQVRRVESSPPAAAAGAKNTRRIHQPPQMAANRTSGGGTPAASELSNQARESLRWEGALEDPQAEEKRLELYRANRRQRYITHRDSVLRESQDALRRTFPKERREKKALTNSVQQETASLQQLGTHLIIEANKS